MYPMALNVGDGFKKHDVFQLLEFDKCHLSSMLLVYNSGEKKEIIQALLLHCTRNILQFTPSHPYALF